MGSQSGLTDADVARILRLIDNLKDVEVRIEVEGMKLHVRKLSAGVAAAGGSPPSMSRLTNEERESPAAAVSPAPVEAQPALEPPIAERVRRGGQAKSIPSNVIAIRAPMLGRFFRAPSPTEPPYVEVGTAVEPEDTVCMIEVMKLFNTVKAGVRGKVVEIAVENSDMVEHDSVLFLVEPA